MKREEFIEKGKSIHGDIYDYSLVEIDPRHVDYVDLICGTHGIFKKLVNSFLSGKGGCPKCARSNCQKKSPEQFLKECQEVHGDTYDYSRLIYIGAEEKITIGCRVHKNWFKKTAYSHLKGVGCPLCAQEGLRLTTEEFIQRSSEIHNNFYDYSETVYTHSSEKLLIQCPVHKKSFSQFPGNHLKGMGCPECGRQRSSEALSWDQEYFLTKCRETHGDLYDYSKSIYVNSHQKVTILCPEHFEFQQSPQSHWSGAKCQKCSDKLRGEEKAWTQEQFIKHCTAIHEGFYNYDETVYTGMGKSLIVSCPLHGLWETSAQQHRNGGKCRTCSSEESGSKPEVTISKILVVLNIAFSFQKSFQDCRNPLTGSLLYFDFHITDSNIIIEYDGKQHFEAVEFWGGQANLEQTQFRDSIKNKYCIDNDIRLIRIAYNQNILERLKEEGVIPQSYVPSFYV